MALLLAGCPGGDGGWRTADCGLDPTSGAEPRSLDVPRPFFDARSQEPNYAGPGREQADPPDIAEVLIGYFGPVPGAGGPNSEFSVDMWCAASLAVEQANEEGGYRNKPFRLVSAWSNNPWGTGVTELTRLVFEDRVWAIVGGIDGPTTHLAEQVAVKARLPLLNPVSTDKTVNFINVPWIFSCTPPDHVQAQVLVEGLAAKVGAGSPDCGLDPTGGAHQQSAVIIPHSSFILVSAVDHDSQLFAVEFQKVVTARRLTCAYHYQFHPADADAHDLVKQIGSGGSEAVVVIAGAQSSARLVRGLRKGGYAGSILGGPGMGQRAFAAQAGHFAEGVIFPCSYVPPAEPSAFEKRFLQRSGRSCDYLVAHTYDAVSILVAAIRRSGLNRARIRDAIRELSPWPGVSGVITWDAPGSNCRPVSLCTITEGRIAPVTPKSFTSASSCPRLR